METWIIPCNIKYYDVFGAFRTLKRIEWRQSTRVEVGDIVGSFPQKVTLGSPVRL